MSKKAQQIAAVGAAIDSIEQMVSNYEKQIALLDEMKEIIHAKRLDCSKRKVLYKRMAFAVNRGDKAEVRNIRHELKDLREVKIKW